MDIKLSQNDIPRARATGGGTRSPPGREPTCVELAAAALRDALASRRAGRLKCNAPERKCKKAP